MNITQFINEGRRKKQEQEIHIEGNSILDKIMNDKETNIDEFVKEFVRPNGPTIYAFVTDKVKDAIKVGYTDQHPEKRIEQWREIYGKEKGEVECLGWWSSEEFNEAGERVFFWDHAIHKKISDKKYKQLTKDEFMRTLTDAGKQIKDIHYSREFFDKYKRLLNGELDPEDKEELSAELIEDIIKQMKLNIKNGTADFKLYSFDKEGNTSGKEANKIWGSPDSYSNTDLQEDAIKNGVQAIKDNKKNILMAAVMRFGKTHASYEIIKEAGLKKIIVCSAKADVRKAWRDDINHVHFYKDFVFIEVLGTNNWDVTYCKDDKLVTEHGIPNIKALEESGKTLIYFFTLHDLGGSVKDIKEKHKNVFNGEFDLMIVDETHYGSHANTFGKVTKLERKQIDDDDNSDIEEEQKIAKEVEDGIKSLDIKYKRILQVSGTPYYILASNEMIDKDAAIISKVSYSDMLNARDKWNKEHKNEDPSKSPYFGIPTLHKIGLRLNKECRKVLEEHNMTGSLSELFKVKGSKFAYEKAVKNLMSSIFGDGKSETLAFLKNKSVEGNKVCKHTLIVLPRIASCEAMKSVLEDIIDTKERQVINIVGNNPDVKNVDELNNKLVYLDEHGKKSIVLTVNRFLTGVSMPLIDSMIYLKNASSPQEYDQNIFRLCTRHVKTVKNTDEEFKSKKVNMKENVYLIDFNITNMFNMIANSAKMKAAAEGNPTTKRIKDLMKEDLGATPIFCEDKGSNEILGKMHKINSKDLMEIYTGYNKNKSIADIVNDEIDLFSNLFEIKEFQDAIEAIDIDADKSKIDLETDDDEGESIDNIGHGTKKEKHKPLKTYIKDKTDKKIINITKDKFKVITKNLLYCNICLDEPCKDVDSIIEKSKEDKDFQKMLNNFKISVKELKKVYDLMSTNYKQAYNTLLMRMSILAQDSSEAGYEKFAKALKGLGRLGKNEVVTPPEIVEKMISKLDKSDYEKADSILIVNDKQAEFLMGIYKKFGKKITEKCKVVPSSEIGKYLCKKMAKSIGIKDIENSILNIKDIDSNGYYDVNDFLNMKNEEILEMNKGKKFDIILMNPPYGDRSNGGMFLDMQFAEKTNKITYKLIIIHPANRWISNTKLGKTNAESKHLKSLEIIDANKEFNIGTCWRWGGIYEYDNLNEYEETLVIFNNKKTSIDLNYLNRVQYWKNIMFDSDLQKIVEKTNNLYKYLKNKYKTMVNDGHGFIYEENRLQRGKNTFGVIKKDQIRLERVKKYLKEGTYKYCLYKGSGNNYYNAVQEWKGQNPDELFNGQLCWLTNNINVKNNIKYWLECPLCDLWRKYYMNGYKMSTMCAYGCIPALNFTMNEKEFKDYVDSLNKFDKNDIKILKEKNIHNANNL